MLSRFELLFRPPFVPAQKRRGRPTDRQKFELLQRHLFPLEKLLSLPITPPRPDSVKGKPSEAFQLSVDSCASSAPDVDLLGTGQSHG